LLTEPILTESQFVSPLEGESAPPWRRRMRVGSFEGETGVRSLNCEGRSVKKRLKNFGFYFSIGV
jgi:hypothetical protein